MVELFPVLLSWLTNFVLLILSRTVLGAFIVLLLVVLVIDTVIYFLKEVLA